jgi:hypothetical protein
MSSKVVWEKRRPDTVISERRVRRRDESEKRGLAVAKALGESMHQEPADKLVRPESPKPSWTIATGADRFASPLRFKPPAAVPSRQAIEPAT